MKSNYEERKARRLEWAESQAEKNDSKSDASYNRAKEIGSYIPFGQPILPGHHSEKRHRSDINKIDNAMRSSVEASKKAEYYRNRAESILNNTAISSDDPNATDKLEEKLKGLEAAQELYKAINKIIKKKIQPAEKITLLIAEGLKEGTATKLLEPDFCNRIGIPSYKLTNNNANIRRIRQRIEHLGKVQAIPSSEKEINGVTMKISQEDNRVQLFFPGKPEEAIRKELKSNGFRFSYEAMAWQRQISSYAIHVAERILNNLKPAI